MLHRRGVRATPHFAFQPVDVIIALRLERVLVLRCVLCSGFQRQVFFARRGLYKGATRFYTGVDEGFGRFIGGHTSVCKSFEKVSEAFGFRDSRFRICVGAQRVRPKLNGSRLHLCNIELGYLVV